MNLDDAAGEGLGPVADVADHEDGDAAVVQVAAARKAKGSSSNRISGRTAKARAPLTRRRMLPLSSAGALSVASATPSRPSHS